MELLNTNRWRKKESYDKQWLERSKIMLDMLAKSKNVEKDKLKIAEFGCGVNSPIASLCKDKKNYLIKKFDIEKWDEDTTVIDLNKASFPEENFDISFFSGVLEYLNYPKNTILSALNVSDSVIFSYAYVQKDNNTSNEELISLVKERAAVNGWRTHYTLEQILSVVSDIGVIIDAEHWRGQVLIYLASHKSINL